MKYRIYIAFAVLLLVPMGVFAQTSQFRNGGSLTVTFLSQDPDPVSPGSYADLRWRVENRGTKDLKDVQFVIDPEYPLILNDPNEGTKMLGDVGTKQVSEDALILHWRVRVDENAIEGTANVRLNYFSEDIGYKLDPFPINIQSRQALLAVDSVEMIPRDPAPGQLVNATILLHNLVETSVEDVKVTLDLSESNLAPIGSTNQKIVQRIDGSETVAVPFTLAVDANAPAKINQIPLRIEYANHFNDQFTLNTSFGVRVAAASDYLMNLESTEVHTANAQGTVTVSISNTGKSDLNFVSIELLPSTDYRVLSTSQVYVGNLQSDDFETAEFSLHVPSTKATTLPLHVRVQFKDAYNEVHEDPVDVQLRLYSSSEARKMGLTSGSSGGWMVVLVLLVIGSIIEWRRRWKEIHWLHDKLRRSPEEPKRKHP